MIAFPKKDTGRPESLDPARYARDVERIARRMARRLPGVDWEDLFQEGMIGLCQALTSFEPARGLRVMSFAEHRVRGAMLDAVRAWDWVPRAERKLQKAGLAEPPRMGSLNRVISAGGENRDTELADALAVPPADVESPRRDEAALLLDGCNPRDRLILVMYHLQELTMSEIGEALGLSASRVSQKYARTIAWLRQREGLVDCQPRTGRPRKS